MAEGSRVTLDDCAFSTRTIAGSCLSYSQDDNPDGNGIPGDKNGPTVLGYGDDDDDLRDQISEVHSTLIILAIDPGVFGALAFLDVGRTNRVAVFDMPVLDGDINPHALRDHIQTFMPDHAVIERASSRPSRASPACWRFSAAYTTACVVVRLMNILLKIITPTEVEKRRYICRAEQDGKEQARRAGYRSVSAACRALQPSQGAHGRAEAALLAFH